MKRLLPIIVLTLLMLTGCGEKLPVVENFSNNHYHLVNQKGEPVVFPDFVKGKIVVMNFIFTNCPDICPLSTNNMRLIQERLNKEKISNVEFVSLSFDPNNDTPEVLTKFADIRGLDLNNWTFLTGQKSVTDSVIHQANVIAVPNDSTVFKDGRKIYYYIHTDRISLIDAEGRIRKNYIGSKINIDEIINDIKKLM
ncbi:MAG: SCO family protein [Bacteroidetes bacterium]|nr:SCO family protein [Bacteroidota bacterium]MCL6100727.1 SCO family protein [Bacteroidota bacterium]